jgi:hypothetical protein
MAEYSEEIAGFIEKNKRMLKYLTGIKHVHTEDGEGGADSATPLEKYLIGYEQDAREEM